MSADLVDLADFASLNILSDVTLSVWPEVFYL
jgi:hypothetical protein